MGGTRTIDRHITRLADKVSQNYRVERFILFGSHARGTAIKGSDYDVIVVSPDFADVPFLERMRLVRALWHFPAGLDCICYTPEEFTRKMDEIGVISEAVKEGIQVV